MIKPNTVIMIAFFVFTEFFPFMGLLSIPTSFSTTPVKNFISLYTLCLQGMQTAPLRKQSAAAAKQTVAADLPAVKRPQFACGFARARQQLPQRHPLQHHCRRPRQLLRPWPLLARLHPAPCP
jgi:hypothetical protein